MKIGTQNQEFFPSAIIDKFHFVKSMGFEGFEIDGKLLVENLAIVKEAVSQTGVPVTTACGGYDGWIGDFNEERRLNGLQEIKEILHALAEVGGEGIVLPAAWGMFSYRLPPMKSPRSQEEDFQKVSESLLYLDNIAGETDTTIYLEPLNRYQDHMINTLFDARNYIERNKLSHVKLIADFYHMNIEEDSLVDALHAHRDLIKHIHLADNHRYQPGSGSIDYETCINQLKIDGYDGFLTFECRVRGNNPLEKYKHSLQTIKSLL
jgi:sugar phosphate isomerase/epimerase